MKKIIRITTIPGSFGLLGGQLKFMSQHYDVVAVSGEGEILNTIAKKENVRTIGVNMTRKITPVKDLIALWKLYKTFRSEKPFIVHTHTPKAGTLGMIAAWFARVPNRLHTIAGLPLVEATGSKRILLNTVEKITYACATKIYPNSHGLISIILNHKFTTKDKLKVIGQGSSNGINVNCFDPSLINDEQKKALKDSLGINESDFTFIFLGRIVRDKGINELIEAFEKLNSEFKNIKLLLVGDYERDLDPLPPNTEKIISTNKNVIFTGWQNDVVPYFAISDVLAFPSYREGFPNVVMQSGAMGLPSIVSDINGCNEIIIQNENGVIIPVKNSDALYHAMKEMLINKDGDTKAMGEKARDMIISRYSQQYIWGELLKEYKIIENA
ncbi:glycosyltransferase [Flavobacteriaceae bacterium R38]|nr:glycosyltransferase [Flavobacteriaceae bacterium R38]